MRNILSFLLVSSVLLLSGCATIVGDDTQVVTVNSDPSGADFEVKDNSGKIVAQGKTPQNIVLAKSDGSYFGKRSYVITFKKDGFKPESLPIKASANGWYIGGNFVFGGLIGWLAVDPFNGGMYTLSPKEPSPKLSPVAQ